MTLPAINYPETTEPRPAKRTRRLEKKLRIGKFKIATLEIGISHEEKVDYNDEDQRFAVLDALFDASDDRNLNLGCGSDDGGKAYGMFELTYGTDIDATYKALTSTILAKIPSATIQYANLDDAWWPSED